jgi:hypothetical protein
MSSQLQDEFKHVKPLVFIDRENVETDKIDELLHESFKYVIISPNKLVKKFLGYVNEKSKNYNISVTFTDNQEIELNYIVKECKDPFILIFSSGYIEDLLKLRLKAIERIIETKKFLCLTDSNDNLIFITKSFQEEGYDIRKTIEQLNNFGLIETI